MLSVWTNLPLRFPHALESDQARTRCIVGQRSAQRDKQSDLACLLAVALEFGLDSGLVMHVLVLSFGNRRQPPTTLKGKLRRSAALGGPVPVWESSPASSGRG
jgi:hypothetical protein